MKHGRQPPMGAAWAGIPAASEFDLDFRPADYFQARDLHFALPSDILGKARRDVVRHAVAKGEEPPAGIDVARLPDAERAALGRIDPRLMGGEFLPPVPQTTVEIVRISLASTTWDQISVRASRCDGLIAYSIVDEYDSADEYELRPQTSSLPLSMRELVNMLDGACHWGGAVMAPVVAQIEEFLESVKDYRGFVTVESDFYPDLGRYYAARFAHYFAAKEAEKD